MIKSLKKALLLIPAYAGILLVSCVIGVLVYMLYFNTAGLVAGKTLQLFDSHALFEGFFIVMPVVLVLSGTLLSCYRIRHSGGGVLPVVMYALLGALTWCILYPMFIESKSRRQTNPNMEMPSLTAGYFRHAGKNIVYVPYSRASAEDCPHDADAVVINENEAPEDTVSMQMINYSEMAGESAPFKDILIRETIPVMPGWIMDGFAAIETRAEHAWNAGYVSWLSFISFGLALFSVYALTFCSEWRLIDIIYLLVMESGVISFNLLYFSDYFSQFRESAAGIGTHMKFFASLDEPVLVCINIFFSLIFIFIGITAALTRVRKNKRRGI